MSAFSLNPEFDETTVLLKYLLPNYESTSSELTRLYQEINSYRSFVNLLQKEGRLLKLRPEEQKQPSREDFPNFSEEAYLELNTDVRDALNKKMFKSGWEHYQQFGFREPRLRALRHLDESHYLKTNQDVREHVQKGLLTDGKTHFRHSGMYENRFFLPLNFDSDKYVSFYPELKPLIAQLGISGADHFTLIGFMTGRLYFVKDGS